MDAPLVLSSRIDPEEIDDESHNLDIFERFPVEFYEETYTPHKPADVLEYIDNVEMHLGTPQQYEGLMFSHHTSSIHAGPTVCLYKRLPSMREKVEAQITLAEKIREMQNEKGKITLIIGSSHGLAPAVKARADFKLSLSKLTFPHQLMRPVLLEAIYRSFTIIAGKRYHK